MSINPSSDGVLRELSAHHTEPFVVLAAAPDTAGAISRDVDRILWAGGVGTQARGDARRLVIDVVRAVLTRESGTSISFDVVIDHNRHITTTITSGIRDLTALLSPAGKGSEEPSVAPWALLDSRAEAWGTHTQHRRTAVWFTVVDSRPDGARADIGDGVQRHRPGGPAVVSAATALAALSPLSPTAADAADVVAEAVAITGALEAALTTPPENAAARAALIVQDATADAGVTIAHAAIATRDARAAAASLAATVVAETTARAADAMRIQAQEVADTVAQAAVQAAALIAQSFTPGSDIESGRAAVQIAATVIATAAAKADETVQAAAVVAAAAEAAATAVAVSTAADADADADAVLEAADAVRAVSAAAEEQLAAETREQDIAVEIAARAAAAESGRLHRTNLLLRQASVHNHAVACALQEAMLTQLPESEHLQLAARYVTAAAQHQVGGDWYDAIILPTGVATLVIGDVIGHDIAAAAVMGQLRNMLRALLWDRDEPPSARITRLDRAIHDLQLQTMATMVLISVEPPTPTQPGISTLRWSNAGHPPPLLLEPDGTITALNGRPDMLLGVNHEATRHDQTRRVANGSTLLLYTDGLIETASQDIDTGVQRLTRSLYAHRGATPPELLDAVLADLVADHPADDVAALATRFHY